VFSTICANYTLKGVSALLLKEILAEVDLLVTNSVTVQNKITFINQMQNEIFKEVHPKQNSYLFYTMNGVDMYDLPDDCGELLELYINGKEYHKRGKDDRNYGDIYTLVNGAVLINPIPDGEYESYFYYHASPTQLTIDNMNVTPDLPSDFHEVLTLGCARKVALIMKDYDSAKILGDQYSTMLRDVLIKLSPKLGKVRRIRRWS
jgi:hypothetical protein